MDNIGTRKKIVIVLFCAVVLSAGIFAWHKIKKPPASQNTGNSQSEKTPKTKKEPPVDESISEIIKTYTNQTLGFSFDYPDNFTPEELTNDSEITVTLHGADGKNGFQVIIDPYTEKTGLSLATIKNSAGVLVMENEKEISIGSDTKIKAFSFTLKNPSADPTDVTSTINEVWFVRNGKLYQISNYADFEGNMDKILASVRFNR
jgi:hypothetical protein